MTRTGVDVGDTIPTATGAAGIRERPLEYFEHWRSQLGDLFAIDMAGPLLSRSPDCPGVYAVFGEAHQRAVLSDIERFVLPVSAAVRLDLPETLRNLNVGLHSKRGRTHDDERRMIASVLAAIDPPRIGGVAAEVAAVVARHARQPLGLLDLMRGMVASLSDRLFFGDAADEGTTEALVSYFHLRRSASAPGMTLDDSMWRRLVDAGNAADAALRSYRREVVRDRSGHDLGGLAPLANGTAGPIDEDAFVGHANVLFVSANEPIAVALTWTLLVLSQLPALRQALRAELAQARVAGPYPASRELPTMRMVVSESLRVLTPNAFMVRVTSEPVTLGGHLLPSGAEIVLSPLVAHRDPSVFADPTRFQPSRWSRIRPSAYCYFPFGAGGHSCVGRALATEMIHSCLSALLDHGDIVLTVDADVDWRVDVMLTPTVDPPVTMVRREPTGAVGGVLRGGVTRLVRLPDEWS